MLRRLQAAHGTELYLIGHFWSSFSCANLTLHLETRHSLPASLRVLAEDHKGDAATWISKPFFVLVAFVLRPSSSHRGFQDSTALVATAEASKQRDFWSTTVVTWS